MAVIIMKILLILFLLIMAAGLSVRPSHKIPVAGASAADWNPKSFWYHPWGRSGTHKGIDIFAREGTPVLAADNGVVILTGFNEMGGLYVLVLGAQWRLYYYAHLQHIDTRVLRWVAAGDVIGGVGSTGNAQGKPPHLHFAIRSLLPLFWQYDSKQPQAWNKVFYLDPGKFLTSRPREPRKT